MFFSLHFPQLVFALSAICSILSLNCMVHAPSQDSPLLRRPALQRLRDAHRWHLMVGPLVIVLCSTVMVAVAIAFEIRHSTQESAGYSALSPFKLVSVRCVIVCLWLVGLCVARCIC